ncbi:hypothetical protein [Kitasatospora sp. GP82]|uniref:hypothetical protein n=1 Tax=Kitasatospora sp. GP82 TaxID=3035089 RepID=UPI002474BB89|nr:hypothetical protein [Kitasatospora sp. GP82]MDH6127528.1 hypothetical protein [Kitasatospora sp. GP82]
MTDFQPQPQWVPPQPAPRPSKRKNAAIGCGAMVAGVAGLVVLGAIVGPPKKEQTQSVAGAAPGSPAVNVSPSTAPSTPASAPAATPAQTATPAASSSAKPGTPPTAPLVVPSSTGKASATDRKAAAAILKANDQHYRELVDQGAALIGSSGYQDWYQHSFNDTSDMDAFKQADAHFTADNEPDALSDWRDDNGNGASALWRLAADGLGPETTDQTRADVAEARQALEKADADADRIAAG